MVAALNEVKDRGRGLEVGADYFLTKLVNDVALVARIRSLVRLKRANEGDYDLVLVSDGNWSQDALRLCSQLRSGPETQRRPILIMLPDSEDDRLAKALELDVNNYLVRPIERDELILRSRTQIRRRRYEERLRDNYTFSVNAVVTDSLTSMYNRRYFESHFVRISAGLAEVGKPISALMLDIDHFKNVNDTHGHEAGDEILQVVAKRIQSNMRGFDTAVQLGDEEFVVLLSNSSLAAGVAAAERLCLSISKEKIFVSSMDGGLDITVSIGVACILAGESDLDNLLRHADAALYEAKHTGRNKVMTAAGNVSLPKSGEAVQGALPSPERPLSPELGTG